MYGSSLSISSFSTETIRYAISVGFFIPVESEQNASSREKAIEWPKLLARVFMRVWMLRSYVTWACNIRLHSCSAASRSWFFRWETSRGARSCSSCFVISFIFGGGGQSLVASSPASCLSALWHFMWSFVHLLLARSCPISASAAEK